MLGWALTVIHSLMPKGVEHHVGAINSDAVRIVIHSLMPKGVEHKFRRMDSFVWFDRDSFVDAERPCPYPHLRDPIRLVRMVNQMVG